MNKTLKTILVATIATTAIAAFFGISVAKANASTVFNTNPLDYATTLVSNYTAQPGCTNCWSPSVTMSAGQVVSVRVYYHNTGNETAYNTRIRMSPQNNPAVNSKIFAGGVWADNASLNLGYATVNISGTPQTITFIPGTAIWYPEHSLTPHYLTASQEASLFSSSGVSIGNIDKDSTCPSSQTFCHQGSLVARFQIGSTVIPPVTYACSDGLDNDSDGLIDYPADPGCTGPTDNDEYNYIPPVVYACSDGHDNDYDGLTDYPNDPGCTGPTDNDEYNVIIPPVTSLTVTTVAPSNITTNSAELNGYLTLSNTTAVSRYFKWGTSSTNLYSTLSVPGSQNYPGSFSSSLNGLSPNTTYYFKAYAVNSAGTTVPASNTLQFSTNSIPVVYACSDGHDNDSDGLTDYPADPGCTGPTDNDEYNYIQPTAYITASTQSATNISQTNSTLNGTFSTNQNQSTVWFEWGTTQNLGYQTNQQTMNNSSGNFYAQISGLQQNTNYYFRACADTTATSQSCGSILNFITTAQPQNNAPTAITTSGNCNASQYSFNMDGSFYSNNNSGYNLNTTTWFQYGTSYPYTTQVGNQTQYGTSGNFNYTLTGLTPNTTYYFQAVAQNSAGTNYGTVLSCTTLPVQVIHQNNPPVVTTVYASSVSQTTARLNGYLNSVGTQTCPIGSNCSNYLSLPAYSNTNVWFEWGTTQALGYTTAQQNLNSATTFSTYLPNLAPNTTYYFRAKAQNNFGVATGTILAFTTQNVNVGPKIIYVNTNTNTGGSGPLVAIDIKSDFASVCTNDGIYYTVNYQNLTTKTLKDVVVQVILPKEQTFLRATRGSFSADANTITVNVGDLTNKEKGTFGIEARINSRSKTSDTLVSTATIVYTHPTTKAQGDAIGYSLVNVTCGNNMVGLAIFADGLGCFGWLIIILIILLLIYLIRRTYKY